MRFPKRKPGKMFFRFLCWRGKQEARALKKILLVGGEKESQEELIRNTFAGSYQLERRDTIADGLEVLNTDPDIAAVLIDRPDALEEVSELISFIGYRNSFVCAIPVLLLTDREHVEIDSVFLGGAALDCVEKPIVPVILRNRVECCIEMINSVSFMEFAEMLKVLPAYIYLKDENGRYVFSSQTWSNLDTGGDPDWSIRGKTDLEAQLDKDNARLAMKTDQELLQSGKGASYIIEEKLNGEDSYLQVIKEPVKRWDGRVGGIIALVSDVTEEERLRRELRKMSVTDNLTGLYNRCYYDEYIHSLKKASIFPLSILTADCDGLKSINDTCGHAAGDEYICMSVKLFRACLPQHSVMFRTGGDEFIIFLPDTTAEKAEEYIRSMREALPEYVISGHQLSISMGCSTMLSPGEDLSAHVKCSDDNMYRDKLEKKAARVRRRRS